MSEFRLTGYQKRVCAMPEDVSLLLAGGKGGSKSWAAAILALRHVEKYGRAARALVIRKGLKELRELAGAFQEVFHLAYGSAARFNQQQNLFTLPNGARLELDQVERLQDQRKFAGRSITMLIVDEVGAYIDPQIVEGLRINLRGAAEIPLRVVWTANPGSCGSGWLFQRFISKGKPWTPFIEEKSGSEWIVSPSTYRDNEFINQDDYRRELIAGTVGDPDLRKAYLDGVWSLNFGAAFAGCLDESRVMVEPEVWTPEVLHKIMAPPPEKPHRRADLEDSARTVNAAFAELPPLEMPDVMPEGWRPGFQLCLGMDYGSAAPSVCYVLARSRGCQGPDGRWYPPNSVIALDEWSHHRPDRLDEGTGISVPVQAAEVLEMARRWKCKPRGALDDACFARHRGQDSQTIADEFREAGIRFSPARKGSRAAGWSLMRTMLSHAGEREKPGLYVSRNCRFFWLTAPFIERDPHDREDIDTRGNDHGLDALRYSILWQPPPAPREQKIPNWF